MARAMAGESCRGAGISCGGWIWPALARRWRWRRAGGAAGAEVRVGLLAAGLAAAADLRASSRLPAAGDPRRRAHGRQRSAGHACRPWRAGAGPVAAAGDAAGRRRARAVRQRRRCAAWWAPALERKHVSAVLRNPDSAGRRSTRPPHDGEPASAPFTLPVPIERHYEAYTARVSIAPPVIGAAAARSHRHPPQRADARRFRRQCQPRTAHAAGGGVRLHRHAARPCPDDEAAREQFLDIMAVEAARMRRLIDDLLSLTRIELNEHVPPAGPRSRWRTWCARPRRRWRRWPAPTASRIDDRGGGRSAAGDRASATS